MHLDTIFQELCSEQSFLSLEFLYINHSWFRPIFKLSSYCETSKAINVLTALFSEWAQWSLHGRSCLQKSNRRKSRPSHLPCCQPCQWSAPFCRRPWFPPDLPATTRCGIRYKRRFQSGRESATSPLTPRSGAGSRRRFSRCSSSGSWRSRRCRWSSAFMTELYARADR